MTAQTITTSVNHDAASVTGLADGEAYTLNAGILTVNADVRWGQNAAVLGNITISSTLGGSFIVDARYIWEIPFTSSTGNVPSLSTLGSNGVSAPSGASGELFRVWANGSLTPSSAGGAMPATGWIKLRSTTGTFISGEVVTLPGGATITISSAGKRSWVHVVGGEGTSITVPRIGDMTTLGDWYVLGSTSGSGNQTLQYPVADICPALSIETSPGSGVYEWYLNGGARWNTATKYISTDARGKFFGCTSGGVITIGLTGTNACGYIPVAGCAIRIPNILVSSSTSASWATNTINTTLGSRWKTVTTSAGVLSISSISACMFVTAANAYTVSISNSSFVDQLSIATTGATTIVSNVAVGLSGSVDQNAINLQTCAAGGILSSIRAVRYTSDASSNTGVLIQDCSNFVCTNIQGEVFGTAANTTRGNSGANAISLYRCYDITINGLTAIGARILSTQCTRIKISSIYYADCHIGVTSSTNAQNGLDISNSTANCVVDGFNAFGGIVGVNPYTAIIGYANSANMEFRNIGSISTPYDAGGATTGAGYIAVGAISLNVTFRRVYCINTRTGAIITYNSSYGLSLINFQADYADSTGMSNNVTIVQGMRNTPVLTGQLAVYGKHWEDGFVSTTAGYVLIAGNEPLSSTAAQLATTAGAPKYTSTGNIAMPTVGDQVTYYQPYFCIGHLSFADSAPVLTATNPQNFTFSYRINKNNGAGASAWKILAYYITATGGVSGTVNITVGSTAQIRVGDRVSGTGVATTAVVQSITNGTTFVVTVANTTTVSGLLSFWKDISTESIDATAGFKLDVQVTTSTATNNNSFASLKINTTSDVPSQQLQYALPVDSYTLTLTGLKTASEVRIYNTSDMSELAGIESTSGTYSYTYPYVSDIGITVIIFGLGWQPLSFTYVLSNANVSIPIQQVVDRVYLNP